MGAAREIRRLLLATAACALAACDTDAAGVDELTIALQSTNADKRAQAAYDIAENYPTDTTVIPVIARLLLDSAKQVRSEAASALISIGRTSRHSGELVCDSQSSAFKSSRALALDVAAGIGVSCSGIASSISALVGDFDAEVRSAAITALARVTSPDNPQVEKTLIDRATTDISDLVRAAAVEALGLSHSLNEQVAITIRSALSDPSPVVREQAAFAITASTSDAKLQSQAKQ